MMENTNWQKQGVQNIIIVFESQHWEIPWNWKIVTYYTKLC